MISAVGLGDVLGAALRDTWPALRTWLGWLIAIVVFMCAGLILAAFFNPSTDSTIILTRPWEAEAAAVDGIGSLAAAFFALASSVRTVKPEFRMTIGLFFGVIGWSLLSALIIVAGLILLIVPGLYLLVKVSLAPYFYLLDQPGESHPIRESFALTRGNFWWTALLFFVVAVITEIVAYAAVVVAELVGLLSPVFILLTLPLVCVAVFAAVQFSYIAYVRWTAVLVANAART